MSIDVNEEQPKNLGIHKMSTILFLTGDSFLQINILVLIKELGYNTRVSELH